MRPAISINLLSRLCFTPPKIDKPPFRVVGVLRPSNETNLARDSNFDDSKKARRKQNRGERTRRKFPDRHLTNREHLIANEKSDEGLAVIFIVHIFPIVPLSPFKGLRARDET